MCVADRPVSLQRLNDRVEGRETFLRDLKPVVSPTSQTFLLNNKV